MLVVCVIVLRPNEVSGPDYIHLRPPIHNNPVNIRYYLFIVRDFLTSLAWDNTEIAGYN